MAKQKDNTDAMIEQLLNANVQENVVEKKVENTNTVVEVVPSYTSAEWEDYAMSKFLPAELQDGKYPKLNGLRRVGELLLGDVLSSMPVESHLSPTSDGNGRAAIIYEIKLLWKLGIPAHIGIGEHLPVKVFRAIGGAHPGNTHQTFSIFPEPIAENRAEARAWRKALRLSVVAYDELPPSEKMADKVEVSQSTEFTSELITNNQINVIKQLCTRNNLNVEDFIASGKKKYTDIRQVPYETASSMIQYLNGLGNKE
jgi:hypothetical protein